MPPILNEAKISYGDPLQAMYSRPHKQKPKQSNKFPKTMFIKRNHLPRDPPIMTCNNCLYPIPKTLKVSYVNGYTHLVAAFMTPVLLTWMPYTFRFTKTIVHHCPFCHVQLGVTEFKPFSKAKKEKRLKLKFQHPTESRGRLVDAATPSRPPVRRVSSRESLKFLQYTVIDESANLRDHMRPLHVASSVKSSITPFNLLAEAVSSSQLVPLVRRANINPNAPPSSEGASAKVKFDTKTPRAVASFLSMKTAESGSSKGKSEAEIAAHCLYTAIPKSGCRFMPQTPNDSKKATPRPSRKGSGTEIPHESASTEDLEKRTDKAAKYKKCKKCHRHKKPKKQDPDLALDVDS